MYAYRSKGDHLYGLVAFLALFVCLQVLLATKELKLLKSFSCALWLVIFIVGKCSWHKSQDASPHLTSGALVVECRAASGLSWVTPWPQPLLMGVACQSCSLHELACFTDMLESWSYLGWKGS